MRIEATYNGPPTSGHGGVTVGRAAELVRRGPVEVRLLAPPPLDTELTPRPDGDAVVVAGPAGDVVRVRPLDEPVEVGRFDLVSTEEVDAAADAYLARVAEHGHPFPTCFGCGPDRPGATGLREFAGAVGDGSVARLRVDGDDPVPDWLVWAGIDCPSAPGSMLPAAEAPAAVVLGTLAGQVEHQVRAGVEHQVRSRLLEVSGRKYTTEVAVLDPDGRAVASARAVWIAVDPAVLG